MRHWRRNMASIPSSPVSAVETPASARDLATLLGEIAAAGHAVAPVGSGTKTRFGNPLSRTAIPLSTGKLTSIIAYEPDDMTLSVEAGATIASVWETLAIRGLTIPIDVPNPGSETIGGLIATGLCGPRRFGSGSLRDALIGIRAAYPDGTLGSAGGMVVKNVSGFDLMRMHLGALGTLGVIVSANFKVVPAARGEATVRVERATIEELDADRVKIHASRIRPVAYEAQRTETGWLESIRIEGRPATVDHMARELAGALGDAATVPFDQSKDLWNAYVSGEALPSDGDATVLQLRGKPSHVRTTIQTALDTFGDVLVDIRASLGLGTVRVVVRNTGNQTEHLSTAIHSLRAWGTDVLVLSAPGALAATIDAFGLPPATLELMRPLKRQFDPWSALNPGRIIPEL